MKGTEAAAGEGAAKMASASGPSSVGFSPVDPGGPSCTSSSGNQGGAWTGVDDGRVVGARARPGRAPVAGMAAQLPVRTTGGSE